VPTDTAVESSVDVVSADEHPAENNITTTATQTTVGERILHRYPSATRFNPSEIESEQAVTEEIASNK